MIDKWCIKIGVSLQGNRPESVSSIPFCSVGQKKKKEQNIYIKVNTANTKKKKKKIPVKAS